MKSKRTLDFIATMRQHGIKEAVAREILSLWDDKEGELATKADLEQVEKRLEASIDQLKEGQKEQREQSKKEIEQAERRLEASIDQLKEGQKEQRKGNRWAIGIAISGFALLGLIITSQNSDMRADIRQLMQIHLNEQQAERTGNSARPAQEGRISAADQRGS